NLRVHPFENPRVISVEKSDAMCATARKCPSAEVGAVAHLASESTNERGCFGASTVRFFNIAAQDSCDGRTRDAGSPRDFVNRHRHDYGPAFASNRSVIARTVRLAFETARSSVRLLN